MKVTVYLGANMGDNPSFNESQRLPWASGLLKMGIL